MAAHELRTPLTSIQGFSEIILNRKNLEESKKNKYLELINTRAVSLGKIINDLLDISRIEAGHAMYLDVEPCQAGDEINSVVEIYKIRYENFNFHTDYKNINTIISVDKEKMKQVFENIMSNAVKYSSDNKEIHISTEIIEPNYLIIIEDEGIGMSKLESSRIFENFYRADQSSTGIEGTGLGMGIAKSIVENHHGKIYVESEINKGTKVTISLPIRAKKLFRGKNKKKPGKIL